MTHGYRTEVEHPWPDNTVVGGFFLIFTNFVLAVGIYFAYRYEKWGSVGLYTYMLLTSFVYHACRAAFFELTRFRDAQVLDHIAVYSVLVYVASSCAAKVELFSPALRARSPHVVHETRVMLYFFQLTPIIYFVVNNPESVWTKVIGFGLPSLVVAGVSISSGAPVFYNFWMGWSGVALFAVAVVFYGVCPHSWYDAAHSLWHVFSMCAVPLIDFACDYRWRAYFRQRELAAAVGKL